MNLIDLAQQFTNEDEARTYLEGLLWPNGPICPHCGVLNEATKLEPRTKGKTHVRKGVWKCNPCQKQFTVTVKTIFEDSHIPLHKWMMAIHLMNASKKGMSALQIKRMLGLGYRAAWFMCHRIRHAMSEQSITKLQGVVETDETYVGGKVKGKGLKAGRDNKTPVVALVERNGRARSFQVERVTVKNLKPIVQEHLHGWSEVMTDEATVYPFLLKNRVASHDTINHSADEYVRKDGSRKIHTNTVEGYFSLLKRGVYGTFHHISVRAGEKEHRFCRSVRHQQSIFSGAAHTYTLAAEVNPQSRRREFSRCVFNHAKGSASRAASRNQERRRKRPQLSS